MIDKKKKNFIIQTLRRATYRWPPRWQADKRTRVGYGEYFCESCGVISRKKHTQMDHVIPVVDPERGYNGLDEYADRMFPDTQYGWQRLCISCHEIKTKEENSKRNKK